MGLCLCDPSPVVSNLMKQKRKYVEGPKARKNFDDAMDALFKVSKDKLRQKIKEKPKKGKN